MAIDTRAKRMSVANMFLVPIIPGITPDGSVDDGDRYHFLNLYFGIAISASSGDVAIINDGFTVMPVSINEGAHPLSRTINDGVSRIPYQITEGADTLV